MSRKIYKKKGDTLMLTSQLVDKNGDTLVDVAAVAQVCTYYQNNGKLVKWAYIVHDSDVVRASDIEERDYQRQSYMMRLYREYRDEDYLKEDAELTDYSTLDADALKLAMDTCNKKLPRFELGAMKNPHLHLVLRLPDNRRVDEVVGWFADCFPQIPDLCKPYKDNRTGSGDRLTNALGYLVHKNDPQKHQYPTSAVVASFDYAGELAAVIEEEHRHAAYHKSRDEIDDVVNDISVNNTTLVEWLKTVPYSLYLRNRKVLDDAELFRFANHAVLPKHRRVFYFESSGCRKGKRGGTGKTTGALVYALWLIQHKYGRSDVTNVSDLYGNNPWVFHASQKHPFEGYAGQPIVVFDDVRGGDMVRLLNGRSNLKAFLSPRPTAIRQDVKFGSCVPVCEYVLISGITGYDEFIRAMAVPSSHRDDEEADNELSQYYRRIWGIFQIKQTPLSGSPNVCTCILNRDYYPVKIPAYYSECDNAYVAGPCYEYLFSHYITSDASDEDINAAVCGTFRPIIELFESYDATHLRVPANADFFANPGRRIPVGGNAPILPDYVLYNYNGVPCHGCYYDIDESGTAIIADDGTVRELVDAAELMLADGSRRDECAAAIRSFSSVAADEFIAAHPLPAIDAVPFPEVQ